MAAFFAADTLGFFASDLRLQNSKEIPKRLPQVGYSLTLGKESEEDVKNCRHFQGGQWLGR